MQEKISALGEKALLQRLRKHVGEGRNVVRAFGEDCAVIDNGSGAYQLVTMDVMVDGKHFRQEWMPPFHLGRKAVNVNVSDISAMGGRAQFFLVSLGLPPDTHTAFVDEVYRGIESATGESDLILAGGNVSASSIFFIDITMIGEVEKDRVLLRNGAREGDAIFVTGPLGAAACGLALLESGYRLESASEDWILQAIRAQLDPPVLQKTAAWLASTACLTSMMDLSDGLATDLPEICRESGTGALLKSGAIPVADCARKTAGPDPLELALSGGEDYHLLFTVSGGRREDFLQMAGTAGVRVHEIGTIVSAKEEIGIEDAAGNRARLVPGFQHFLKTNEHRTSR